MQITEKQVPLAHMIHTCGLQNCFNVLNIGQYYTMLERAKEHHIEVRIVFEELERILDDPVSSS